MDGENQRVMTLVVSAMIIGVIVAFSIVSWILIVVGR